MQQEWDNLDKIIFSSFEEIEVLEDYNIKLITKVEKRKENIIFQKNMAFSLILAGLLIIIIYSSNMQYQLANIEYKVRSKIFTLNYNYNDNFNIINNLSGE